MDVRVQLLKICNYNVSPCNHVCFLVLSADESDSGVGLCGLLLTMISWGLVLVTLPFSLCVCFKVVQEYERAVIFRLGRLLHGGSRGPGKPIFYFFFIEG